MATLGLTVGWAIWHAAQFLFLPGFVDMGVAGAIGYLCSLLTGTMSLTRRHIKSQGSLLAVAHFHAGVDETFTSAAALSVAVNTTGAPIKPWAAIVLTAGSRRLASQRKPPS